MLVIGWVIFNKVPVKVETLFSTVFSQIAKRMLVSAKSFCICKCHKINVIGIKFPGNKAPVYPLMEIRANDSDQFFHVYRKTLENHLPRT